MPHTRLSIAFLCLLGATTVAAAADPIAQLADHLKSPLAERQSLSALDFAQVPLSREQAELARTMLWEDFARHVRSERAAEMESRTIKLGELQMPFAYKIFGDKPATGRSLYISLHGGGNAPARVNDRQWDNQKNLYEPEEGVYVAPRAPTNTWNLWHEAHIDDFFDRLITNMVVHEEVNPNRVYVMGYSAGGDGVFQLAPRMADRWAAPAMMAGHPNETVPDGLRNIGFTIHMGGRDAAYQRNEVARAWKTKLASLHEADPQGYQHLVVIHEDKAHWMERQDAVAVPWMAQFTRDPLPETIVWKQDDVTHRRFYWLGMPTPQNGARVVVHRSGQTITVVEAPDADLQLTIFLDDRLANLDQPVRIMQGDQTLFEGNVVRNLATLYDTLVDREDVELMFCAQVTVK